MTKFPCWYLKLKLIHWTMKYWWRKGYLTYRTFQILAFSKSKTNPRFKIKNKFILLLHKKLIFLFLSEQRSSSWKQKTKSWNWKCCSGMKLSTQYSWACYFISWSKKQNLIRIRYGFLFNKVYTNNLYVYSLNTSSHTVFIKHVAYIRKTWNPWISVFYYNRFLGL